MRKLLVPAIVILALGFAGATIAQTTTDMTQEKTTTTKVKDPNGPTTKTKKVSVIGTVKEYDAGKSIKIATSKSHSKSFDLSAKDTTATVDPSVAVGSKVKLTDAKDDGGNHTITVEPYTGKAAKHHKGKAAASTTSTAPSTANP